MPNQRMTKLNKVFDKSKTYPIAEAVDIVKKCATAKFDETIEVHLNLGIDPKKGEQLVRGMMVFPHAFGASKRVAAFVSDDKVKDAKEAGADIVVPVAEFGAFKDSGKLDFDVAVAMPDIMKNMAPLARILGPKGLMPSPKNETITTNLKKTIDELKKGKTSFKNDDTANIHQKIGKKSLDNAKIIANFETIMDAIKKAKPDSSKGVFLKTIVICSSMGPAVKVDIK